MTSDTLETCAVGAQKYAGKSLLSLIGMGLYMLKAHAITAQPTARKGAALNRCATVAHFGDGDAPAGFDQWLQETFQEAPVSISRRSAYNYIRAALRLGLTPDSTEADIDALEKSNALAGKSARQLYMPESSAGTERQPEKHHPKMEQGDLLLGWEMQMDDLLTPESPAQRALPLLPLQKLEEMERKIRTALDLITEAKTSARRGTKK